MCVNFTPSSAKIIQEELNAAISDGYDHDVYPGAFAPVVLRSPNTGLRTAQMARFGLLPAFAQDVKFCRNTYNARSETVAEKPSFKQAWAKGRFCLVPVRAFVEPYYARLATDDIAQLDLLAVDAPRPPRYAKPVPWAIGMADGRDFAIAGLWSWWRNPATGTGEASFAMLTLNADTHPFMNRMHAPGDEKRMPYIVRREDYGTWLSASPELAREMIGAYPAEGMAGGAV